MSTRAVLGCVLLAVAAPAHAQPKAQAEVLFHRGLELMDAGKVADACDAFADSQKLDPVATTLLNLASCREKLGQLATAWGLFLEAERETRSVATPRSQKLHQIAHDHAAKLEPRVSHLTIHVPETSKVDDLAIARDGEPIPSTRWDIALPVDGGTYTITASAGSGRTWMTQVTLAPEGDAKTVEIPDLTIPDNPDNQQSEKPPPECTPPDRDGCPDKKHPPPPPPPPRPPAESGRRIALSIAIGVGAVALLGSAFGVSRSADSTYDKASAETVDQLRRDSLYESANHRRYAAEGLAIAGIGCAGLAVWLYVRRPTARRETTAANHMMIAPTASGIAVTGRF